MVAMNMAEFFSETEVSMAEASGDTVANVDVPSLLS